MKTSIAKKAAYGCWTLLLAGSLAFTACNNDDDMAATPQLNDTDAQFMRMAVMGNNAEIQTSRLALDRSQDADVKNFAQMMITHHRMANKSLDSLGRLRNFTLPDSTAVDTMARSMITKLSSLRDSSASSMGGMRTSFSREYLMGQIQAHTKSQSDYQAYINNAQAQDAGLKGYATKTLPVVQNHLQMANTLSTQKENAAQ